MKKSALMLQPAHKVYQIGPFRLDVFELRLWRDGAVIPLLGPTYGANR